MGGLGLQSSKITRNTESCCGILPATFLPSQSATTR